MLEYIEGGELFDYLIKKGRLEEREAVHYFRQIINGVDYCHRFNICHRDLKPENLLLDKHRNIKIADFGMAALETSDKMLETSCGSPHYASPEIVAGKSYHGGPSDIWSCGIILFALLTGHLPFDDDNIRKLLLKVQEGKFQMPPELSPHAKDLIWKMLRVDPNTRISMPDILKHGLLRKYPPKRTNMRPSHHPISREMVDHPVKNIDDIDPEILKNLQTLWHGADRDTVVKNLLSPEPNSEKTFYCLLLKYRHDHNTSQKKKTQPSGVLSPNAYKKSPSQASIHKSRHSHSRSLSRGSRTKVVYHSRSGSKSSIISTSSASRRRTHHKRNKSAASSKASSPPPPLPTEAAKIIEQERARTSWVDEPNARASYLEPARNSKSSWVEDKRNSADFASMLEQAFNFDNAANYYQTAEAEQPSNMGIAYSEPTRTRGYQNPIATSSATYREPQVHEPILEETEQPTVRPRQSFIAMDFEHDRFADALEEEMSLHLGRTALDAVAETAPSKFAPITPSPGMASTPYMAQSAKTTATPEATFFSEKSSLQLPSIPDTPVYDDVSLQKMHAHQQAWHGRDESYDEGDSRLRISGLLRAESFKTGTTSPQVRPKSSMIGSTPPLLSMQQSYQKSPQLNYNSTMQGRTRNSAPQPTREKAVQNDRQRAVSANAAAASVADTGYERMITSKDHMPYKIQPPAEKPKAEVTCKPSRGASLLKRFTGGAPKRAAPAAPVESQPSSRVASGQQARAVSSQSQLPPQPQVLQKRTPSAAATASEPKSRVVSAADTVASTSTWQSRQSTATADTEYSAHSTSPYAKHTATEHQQQQSSAPTTKAVTYGSATHQYQPPTSSHLPTGGLSSAASGPKQNWFMKMLGSSRSPDGEIKGFYSSFPAPDLRKLIVGILKEWQRYGISNIDEDMTTSTIRAKISSRNALSLRSSKFRIEIESHSVRSSYYKQQPLYRPRNNNNNNNNRAASASSAADSSNSQSVTSVTIVQERGSTNSFLRFVGEIRKALEERDALVSDDGSAANNANEGTTAADQRQVNVGNMNAVSSSLGIYV